MSMEEASSGTGSEPTEEKGTFQYFGWIYHIGVNSVGREYCHPRFLLIKGKRFNVYRRDPHENPGIKPIRQGVLGATLMVEELGSRKVNNVDLHIIQVYSRVDESRKGEIACATAEEAQNWKEAFEHARQQVEHELSTESSAREQLIQEMEILRVNRHRVRRYASGLKKLIKIGQGPESLSRISSKFTGRSDGFDGDNGDAFDAHQWKCVRTMSGIRIFEDVLGHKNGKGVLAKSVGAIDATADSVFEVFLNTDRQKRYEWDMLMGDLELVQSYDGHYDVVYGTYDPKYLTRWHSKRDFIFSRQWFRGQDGTYTILQFPYIHKKKPPRSGYRRTKINPSTWEIRNLNRPMGSDRPRCLVTHTLEINSASWHKWKNSQQCSKFEKSIPYALLCQVAGLKEYIGANPEFLQDYATSCRSQNTSNVSMSGVEFAETELQDEFYDAIGVEALSSDEESDEEKELDPKTTAPHLSKELDPCASPITIDVSRIHGTLCKGEHENDTNCWTIPGGEGFMVRGKNYLKDNSKVGGGVPLLKLIAVDWLKVGKAVDRIALHHRSLVQSEAGKQLPFILVFNLQVPAKSNYSLVLYYASDRPIKENSLLAKFLDGNDEFRDSRFKLIPSIVEGYWMVKRAVGTKACLLGKAVTCKYFRQDNFFEIDVDIGSSSVARSVIGLVMGYVTSLVVDLAILIEGKEESELPEYILGTVRLNRIKLDSAVPLEV